MASFKYITLHRIIHVIIYNFFIKYLVNIYLYNYINNLQILEAVNEFHWKYGNYRHKIDYSVLTLLPCFSIANIESLNVTVSEFRQWW